MERIYEYLNEALPVDIDCMFSNINFGGCGVFAYILARELNNVGIKAGIIWLDNSDEDNFNNAFENVIKDNSTPTLEDMFDYGIRCKHCMVEIGNKVIDSTGVYDSPYDAGFYANIVGFLSYEDMRPFAESSNGWNDMFCRSQIPEMEREIKNIALDLEVIK